jgi:tetratricopeptide (TPR) repeat protein
LLVEAESLFDQTPALQNVGDPIIANTRSWVEMQLGVNLFDQGDFGHALNRLTACVERLRRARLTSELHIAYNYYAQLMIACGRWQEASEALEYAIALDGQGAVDSGWHANNVALLALVRSRTAGRDECRSLAEDALAESERTQLVDLLPLVRNLLAQVVLDLADGDEQWLSDCDRLASVTISETRRTGMVRSEVMALILRSRVARLRAETELAVAFADQALAILDAYGALPAVRTEEVLFHAAMAHAAAGQTDAKDLLRRAAAEVERKASSLNGEYRRTFLTEVPTNAAILVRARSGSDNLLD